MNLPSQGGPAPSADQAIEEAREVWQRGYRDAVAAGREVPYVDVPRELGDVARTAVEATQGLTRLGNRRSYTVDIDLAELERQRRARERQAERDRRQALDKRDNRAKQAQHQRRTKRRRPAQRAKG